MVPERLPCPLCGAESRLVTRDAVYRRGGRSVKVVTRVRRCDAPAPKLEEHRGEVPFEFLDAPLLRENDEVARKVWKETFGEEMPVGRPK